MLGTRLFVGPRLRTLPAFEINPASFMQVLADDLCQAIEGFHSKPLRVLLRFAALVLPSFRDRDGKLRYGCSLLAVFHIRVTAEISDQHYFLHLLLLLLLSSFCLVSSGRYEQPLVLPHVPHRWQVPLRTISEPQMLQAGASPIWISSPSAPVGSVP